MARLARAVVPGVPHHVTQRGNRRQTTFFNDADYAAYLGEIGAGLRAASVGLWAWCLMPNHVHLILLPSSEDGLAAGLGEAHRRYTRRINHREGWRGYLWQGRFASFPLDERHLMAAVRYVELNPVRARLAARPEDWPWSSARAHLGMPDMAAKSAPLAPSPPLDAIEDWRGILSSGLDEETAETLRSHERTGRPLGSDSFIARLEARLGRRPQTWPPRPQAKDAGRERRQ